MHREWYAPCYEAYEKARIERDNDGKPIYIKADDGRLHVNYLFKCKRCVAAHPLTFILLMCDSFQVWKKHFSSPWIQLHEQSQQTRRSLRFKPRRSTSTTNDGRLFLRFHLHLRETTDTPCSLDYGLSSSYVHCRGLRISCHHQDAEPAR
jgi:hypothetical protein